MNNHDNQEGLKEQLAPKESPPEPAPIQSTGEISDNVSVTFGEVYITLTML